MADRDKADSTAVLSEITIANRATEDRLAELHGAVAEYFVKKFADGNPSPQDVTNAIKFLKDNQIRAHLMPDQTNHEAIQECLNALPSTKDELSEFLRLT